MFKYYFIQFKPHTNMQRGDKNSMKSYSWLNYSISRFLNHEDDQ